MSLVKQTVSKGPSEDRISAIKQAFLGTQQNVSKSIDRIIELDLPHTPKKIKRGGSSKKYNKTQLLNVEGDRGPVRESVTIEEIIGCCW